MNAEALTWVRSSYSGAEGGQCVEVAVRPDRVHVRDSKDTNRPPLTVEPGTWAAFVEHAAL
ncbi:DUF397 domain-containing protein [Streptomyces sp. NPDC001480]|uniref:DUF397 domain-containing protein n=1 Tax=Streptomyces sp. NPDC001480 TaxID=3364577 RepID=UPI0036AB8CF8